jgi:hypothetical protein
VGVIKATNRVSSSRISFPSLRSPAAIPKQRFSSKRRLRLRTAGGLATPA